MEVGGKSYGSGDDYTSDYLSVNDNTVKVTVIDTRGFTQTETIDITVIPYSKPKVVSTSDTEEVICARCDKDGNLTDSGTYLKIVAKRSYSPCLVDGVKRNYCTLRYRYKKVTDSDFSSWYTLLLDSIVVDEASDILLSGTLSATASYIVEVGVIDDLGEQSHITFEIPTDKVFMHKAGSRRSIAFGKYVEEDNAIEVADDITLLLGGNVAEAEVSSSSSDKVGSIRYASGLLIQWGAVTITPSAVNTPTFATVTFPTPYKSIPFAVPSADTSVPGISLLGVSINNLSATEFEVVLTRNDLTSTHIRWMAIGFE